MEVENTKLGSFDLLNTFLLNLSQHTAIPSNFLLPTHGKSALANAFIWLNKSLLGSPGDVECDQRLL